MRLEHASVPQPRASFITNPRKWAVWCARLALAVLLAIPPASAFESIPPGESAHDRITAEAATALGWPERGQQSLKAAVRAPDLAESLVEGDADDVIVLDASDMYQPSHHCDRVPPATHAQAFDAAAAYVRRERDEAVQWVLAGHADRAVDAIGRSLHALQDCHSHSDIAEKDAVARDHFQDALVLGGPGPVGLRLTGFQPEADLPALPPGDLYPHGDYAKDGANSTHDAESRLPDGRTKFEAARSLAVSNSHLLLEDFLARLEPEQRQAVMAIESPPSRGAEDIGGPGAAWFLIALVAAGCFLRNRS